MNKISHSELEEIEATESMKTLIRLRSISACIPLMIINYLLSRLDNRKIGMSSIN
jgi:hypothetical protein